jgi:hypothetical protein
VWWVDWVPMPKRWRSHVDAAACIGEIDVAAVVAVDVVANVRIVDVEECDRLEWMAM